MAGAEAEEQPPWSAAVAVLLVDMHAFLPESVGPSEWRWWSLLGTYLQGEGERLREVVSSQLVEVIL